MPQFSADAFQNHSYSYYTPNQLQSNAIIYQYMNSEDDKPNRMNNYVYQNPISQIKAERLENKYSKSLCKSFGPFRQYYLQYPVQYLVEPSPTLPPGAKEFNKSSLSIGKQIQYYRGSSRHPISESYFSTLLESQMKTRGFVQNQKSKSELIENLLIFANGNQLSSISIDSKGQKIKKHLKLINFQSYQPIFQVSRLPDNHLLIRAMHWLFLFAIQDNKKLLQIKFHEQITAARKFTDRNSICVTTYENNQHMLYEWDLSKNLKILLYQSESFYHANSIVSLNSRQLIISFANKLVIQDIRCPNNETMRRVQQIGNDRYYCIAQFQSMKNIFVLSRSHFIDVFDIRNYSKNLVSSRHFCQESPPSCLLTQIWVSPIVIAYSPTYYGSSIMLNLDELQNQKDNKLRGQIFKQQKNLPMILYDSGKYYRELYPKSICLSIKQNVLSLFHIDNANGISLQRLKKQQFGKQYQVKVIGKQYQVKYPEDPWKKWVDNKIIQPYIKVSRKKVSGEKDPPEAQEACEDEESSSSSSSCEQNGILKKNVNYCSLERFLKKIKQLSKIENCQIEGKNPVIQETYPSSLDDKDNVEVDWSQILKAKRQKVGNYQKISEKHLYEMESLWKI